MANIDKTVPKTDPIMPSTAIKMSLTISNLDMPCFQKHRMCSNGGKTKAIDELETAPTNAMKLSSCGIVIANAPKTKYNVGL